MHEFLRSKTTKPIPKFSQTSSFWENPKHFPKTSIFRSKDVKMHENEGWRHLPSEENLIEAKKSFEEEVGSERERYWEVRSQERSREIERKWELNRADPIYSTSVILDRSRGIEV